MINDLTTINKRAMTDPLVFASECERECNERAKEVAESIVKKMADSHVAFLAGPSASGKTTTAKKICAKLEAIGVRGYVISMDHYFKTLDPVTAPRTETGEIDYESPLCIDTDLLNEHTDMLERGEEIQKPYFDFKNQRRDPHKTLSIQLKDNEVLIFEGIHALNDTLSNHSPKSLKIFINTQSDIEIDGRPVFKRSWRRLMRRILRDERFRGTGVLETLQMWTNVRRGEAMYIEPFQYRADVIFDTSLSYEVSVLKPFVLNAIDGVDISADPSGEMKELLPILHEFEEIDSDVIPLNSILREFVGGGVFEY